jgi:predicted transcriptional regulator
MFDLFPKLSVRIERIGVDDARRSTDLLGTLRERLARHESYYPSILKWTANKVLPDLRTGRRIAYIGFQDDVPILAAVLKQGIDAKFCHLSIESGFQGNKLGHLMFSLMAAEVRRTAREIHFTLPASLWERERGFFNSFGFDSAAPASTQYRLFEDELRCSVSYPRIWECVLTQLPMLLTSTAIAGFQVNDGVILSVQEKYATAVMYGRKTIELRRRFASRWVGRNASVYAAGGSGCLMGTITISDVVKAKPGEIWDRFGDDIGCTRSEFEQYAGDRSYLYAIRLTNPKPYQAPVPLSQLSYLLGEHITPPQSYSAHSTTDLWGKALSVAALLHSRLGAH